MSDFVAKSETTNEFNLLDLRGKTDMILEDAVNCPLVDGELRVCITNNELKEKFTVLQDLLLYDSDKIEDLKDNIKSLIKLAREAALKNYQIVKYLMTPAIESKLKKSDIKIRDIISEMLLDLDAKQQVIEVSNDKAANTLPLLSNGETEINSNTIINNINNSIYSPFDNAIKWLTENVKFGGTVDKDEVIPLFNLFTWPQVINTVAPYQPVKDGNKRLWFRLTDYKFDTNIYKYAFGALSALYPGNRIIFLCNTSTGAWTVQLVNASDIVK